MTLNQASKRTDGWSTPFGRNINAYAVGGEFYLYQGQKLIRVCPSIGMAREVAAGL